MATVYRFRAWDQVFAAWTIPAVKMTEENIRAIGGMPLPGTGELVDPALLDENGEYHMQRRTG